MHAYKAALLYALTLRQIFTPAQMRMLNKLVNMFHKRRLLKPSPIPKWDIGLHAFTPAPFELLDSASLQAITYKELVLVTIPLGARRGEFFALHRGQFIFPAEDWSFILLYSDLSFIPKTAKGRLPTEPFKLKALPPSAPPRGDATAR